MKSFLKNALLLSLVLLVLCGLIYPLALTGFSSVFFPQKATGSLIEVDGNVVGSAIVGQKFTSPQFLHGRPSAVNYNTYTEEQKENGEYAGLASGSQNLAPSNPQLIERVEKDVENFLRENPTVQKADIPADMVTASGSGLDPHISLQSALIQVKRISKNTGLSDIQIQSFIAQNTSPKLFGIFGEETVNVLGVNLAIAKALGVIKEYHLH